MAEALSQIEGDKLFLGDVEILGQIKNAGLSSIVTKLEKTRSEAQNVRADLDTFFENIISDGIVDVSEKKLLLQKWQEIATEYPIVRQRGIDAGLSNSSVQITSYESAYQTLDEILNGAGGILTDMENASSVDKLEVELRFRNYHTAKANLDTGTLSTAMETVSHVFFDQPVGPYKRGDLWIHDGALYQATTDRPAGVFITADWVWSIRANVTVLIESTNGDKFRPGQSTSTTLIGRAFKNGVEITGTIPDSLFRWTRRSFFTPNDDAVWNANHQSGYRSVEVTTDSINARATYTLEILE